jgi:hypothetical protein
MIIRLWLIPLASHHYIAIHALKFAKGFKKLRGRLRLRLRLRFISSSTVQLLW